MIKQLRIKLKEKELENNELKSHTIEARKRIDRDDLRLYKKIEALEQVLEKNINDIDDRNLSIVKLKKEIESLNDNIDIINEENRKLLASVNKFHELSKKLKNVQNLEKEVQALNIKLKESYQDKEILLIELQNLRMNSKQVEYIEKQIQILKEEKIKVNKELLLVKDQYEELQLAYSKQNELVTQIPTLKEEIYYFQKLNEDPYYSQRPSMNSQHDSIMIEELKVKIAQLTEENMKLNADISAKENNKSIMENIHCFGLREEASILKAAMLECEYYEFKLKASNMEKELSEKIKELVIELNHTKEECKKLNDQCKGYISRIENFENNIKENDKTLTKLRSENLKLRDTLFQVRNSKELEKMKNINVDLQQEILKLKAELLENFQTIYALKSEKNQLNDIIEE